MGLAQAMGATVGRKLSLHIDDITSVTVDIGPFAPYRGSCSKLRPTLRQAESSRSFGRPDIALKDYIRASTVVVDVLKKNKGWVSIQSGDNRVQLERYQRLMRQIASIS